MLCSLIMLTIGSHGAPAAEVAVRSTTPGADVLFKFQTGVYTVPVHARSVAFCYIRVNIISVWECPLIAWGRAALKDAYVCLATQYTAAPLTIHRTCHNISII